MACDAYIMDDLWKLDQAVDLCALTSWFGWLDNSYWLFRLPTAFDRCIHHRSESNLGDFQNCSTHKSNNHSNRIRTSVFNREVEKIWLCDNKISIIRVMQRWQRWQTVDSTGAWIWFSLIIAMNLMSPPTDTESYSRYKCAVHSARRPIQYASSSINVSVAVSCAIAHRRSASVCERARPPNTMPMRTAGILWSY